MDDQQLHAPFPLQFAALEEKLRTAEEENRQIEEQIKWVREKGPRPEFNPPDKPPGNGPLTRATQIAQLRQQQAEIKAAIKQQAVIDTAKADPKMVRKIGDQITFRMDSSNAYRDKTKEEMLKDGSNERKLTRTDDPSRDHSYDYMASLHYKGQTFGQALVPEKIPKD